MGVVLTSEIGVADLKTLLQEKRLRPKTIKIRDYQIAPANLESCPEMNRVRDLVKDIAPATAEPVPVATFARNVVEGANLAVKALTIQHASLPLAEDSIIHSGRFGNSALGEPKIKEAIIELFPEYQGVEQGMEFSLLHSADLLLGCEATPYWLEQVFYKATALKILELSIQHPGGPWLTAGRVVVPKLTTFALSHTRISAKDILAMIASSKDSLASIHLRQVTLHEDGSTWREVLLRIAEQYKALTSFSLAILRDETGGGLALDFREARNNQIPEECQLGLNLVEKGPPHNRRVTTASYDGPNAGHVLEILISLVQAGVPNDQDVVSRLHDD